MESVDVSLIIGDTLSVLFAISVVTTIGDSANNENFVDAIDSWDGIIYLQKEVKDLVNSDLKTFNLVLVNNGDPAIFRSTSDVIVLFMFKFYDAIS